jgi:CelD/BcsL family acetyltransferase involved in cellulose biosynthesis
MDASAARLQAVAKSAPLNGGKSVSTKFQIINPIEDARWSTFVDRHPSASVFHSRDWLEALRRTYNYNPLVYTTAEAGEELKNGAVFCVVRSWLVYPRLVSLPFSDHSEPLTEDRKQLVQLLELLKAEQKQKKWTSIEFRLPTEEHGPLSDWPGFHEERSYYLHSLDLRPELPHLFQGLHKSSIQRKVQRARRERLQYEEGTSKEQLREFFRLTQLTRRRHGLPPAPIAWYRNVLDCFGAKAKIRLVRKDGCAIAAIFTLLHKNTLVYKYGCSDARFHNLGGMPFLLWEAIVDGKAQGAQTFDLGRSDRENAGLVTFKDRLGASRSGVSLQMYPGYAHKSGSGAWSSKMAQVVFRRLPEPLLTLAGRILYPHVG